MAGNRRFIDVDDAIGSLRDQMASCPPVQRSDAFPDALVKACVPKLLRDVLVWLMNRPVIDAVELPCKIGDDVYIIPSKVNYDLNVFSGFKNNNRVYHQKVAEIVFLKDCWYVSGNADKAYGTGNVLLDRFFKETWFLTREEAEAALAKMGGDGNA